METKVISREYVEKNYIHKDKIKKYIQELNEQIEEAEVNIENSVDEERTYWKKEKHDYAMQKFILEELLEDTEDEQIQKQEDRN